MQNKYICLYVKLLQPRSRHGSDVTRGQRQGSRSCKEVLLFLYLLCIWIEKTDDFQVVCSLLNEILL